MALTNSIPQLNLKIDNAANNTTGQIQWLGTNGQKEILQSLSSVLLNRGVFVVPDITTLSLTAGSDTKIVFVETTGLFVWDVNPLPPVPNTIILANGGGVWKLVMSNGVSFVGTLGSGASSYTVAHDRGTIIPEVVVYRQSLSSTGLPYTLVTAYTLTVTDQNTIVIDFGTITTANYTVVVKKL